jgi:DNA-binding XRE family transcriptional regulator
MGKDELISLLSRQFKLVRTEFSYTQEEMAEKLGLSKKTLVQIEKGRQAASWMHVVALTALFEESVILQNALGGAPLEVVKTITHHHYGGEKPKTLGGKVWWVEKENSNGFIVQQNIITHHYRILDKNYRRWYSSFDQVFIYTKFQELTGKEENWIQTLKLTELNSQ